MLARACENEAENAKRMRMGMEPVSQALPSSLLASPGLDTMPSPPQLSLTSATKMDYKSEQLVNLLSQSGSMGAAASPPSGGGWRHGVASTAIPQQSNLSSQQNAAAGWAFARGHHSLEAQPFRSRETHDSTVKAFPEI